MLGTSAAASATNDVLDRGGTAEQAIHTGTAAFFIETLTETFSLSELDMFKDTGAAGIKAALKAGGKGKWAKILGQIAKSVGISKGINASEEWLSEAGNQLYDTLANGDISQFSTTVRKYMADGMSEEDARKKVAIEFAYQRIESAASGAFIGLLSGGGDAALNYVTENAAYKKLNSKNLNMYGSDASALVAEGLSAPEGSKSRVLAEQLQAKLDSGQQLTGADITAMITANEKQFTAEDTAKINRAVQSRLIELGESSNVDVLSSAITKQINGQELTDAEQKVISESKHGQRVLNEASPENIKAGAYSSSWVKDIGTHKINADVYNASAEVSGIGIDNSVDNAVQNGYNNNRGDTNVYNQGGIRASTGESAQVNTRGEKTDGRKWREDEETFTARNQGNTQETGRRGRTLLKFKNQSIAYTPASSEHISDGGKTATLLNSCGIETVYVDGDIEIHENGVTRLHSQGLTTPDGKVLISSNATATDVELAAHEAVHVNDIWQSEAYINYESVIRENVRWNSDKYSEIAVIINNGHYGGRYDIQDFSFSTKFIRELAAYVNQFVVTDIAWAETQFAELFDNWDAVVDASRQFNKDIEADFSESAFSMDENSDSQSSAKGITEPDISKDTRSHEERVVEKMNGKENAREKDRREVKRLGKLLGWEVRFDDIYARDNQGNIVYMTDKDGRQILDKNGEPIPKRAESKVNKGKKIITFDYNNSKPIKTLLKHELTHFLETNAGVYRDFLNKVIESDAFKNWLQTSKNTDLKTYRDSVIEKYKGTNGFETAESSQISAEYEMVAEFVEENLFGDGTKMVNEIVQQMNTDQRSKFAQFIDKIFEKLKNFFSGKKQLSEIEALEQEWLKAYKAAEQTWQQQKNTTENSGEQYAIRKGVARKGKSVYNEYATNVMRWANSAGTNVGDVKIFNDRGKEFVLNEATEDGYIEIARGSYEEVSGYYEEMRQRADNSFYEYTKQIRAKRDGSMRTVQHNNRIGRHTLRNSGPSGSQGLQTDTTGDNEYLRTGHKGKRTNAINKTGKAELEDSAFSMPTDEEYSLATDNEVLLSMYENGEITREEYLRGIGKTELERVANYTETQYNNFGWVSYNNVVTAKEREILFSRYADYKHNKNKYPTTRFGEAVIHSTECPDVIMYIKGQIRSPHVTKVLRINIDDYNASIIKELILQNEYRQISLPYSSTEDMYGQEVLSISYKRDCASFQEYRAEQKGRNSKSSYTVSDGEQNRGRGIKQNTETNTAELEDSAFSMPGNIRRSIPVDTDTDTDADTDNDIIADFQKLNNEFNKGNIEEETYMQQVAELYEEIVKKNGRIKPGEVGKTKYQDIPVPKRIDKKTKVQRHVRTILEGGELTDEMVSTVKADILSGEFNYTPTSNKKNIAYAEDAVMKGAAVGIWERAINGDGLPTATDIAVGEALLKLAVERGNAAEVVRYTAELAELGTRLGQSVYL